MILAKNDFSHRAFLGLGSNLGSKKANLSYAINKLREEPQVSLEACSGLYQSQPVGLTEDNPESFLNMVIRISTSLSPVELLQYCQKIEDELGRKRKKNLVLSRPIDIDLLFFDKLIMHTEDLILPHPKALKRDFVAIPLKEVIDQSWREPLSGLLYDEICHNGSALNSGLQRIGDWTF